MDGGGELGDRTLDVVDYAVIAAYFLLVMSVGFWAGLLIVRAGSSQFPFATIPQIFASNESENEGGLAKAQLVDVHSFVRSLPFVDFSSYARGKSTAGRRLARSSPATSDPERSGASRRKCTL